MKGLEFKKLLSFYSHHYDGKYLYLVLNSLYSKEKVEVLREEGSWSVSSNQRKFHCTGEDISGVITFMNFLGADISEAHTSVYNSVILMAIVAEMQNNQKLFSLCFDFVEKSHFEEQKKKWDDFGKALADKVSSLVK